MSGTRQDVALQLIGSVALVTGRDKQSVRSSSRSTAAPQAQHGSGGSSIVRGDSYSATEKRKYMPFLANAPIVGYGGFLTQGLLSLSFNEKLYCNRITALPALLFVISPLSFLISSSLPLSVLIIPDSTEMN